MSSRLIHEFQKSGIISADISKIKVWKSHYVFVKSTYLWKKIFIPRYDMIIFIYKSWSVNSAWLPLLVRSKFMRGDCFNYKMLLTIFNLQERNF